MSIALHIFFEIFLQYTGRLLQEVIGSAVNLDKIIPSTFIWRGGCMLIVNCATCTDLVFTKKFLEENAYFKEESF